MIEPVVATALILSILALIAYYLQPQQPHHQRHYYHQVRRPRVMAGPQRRGRGGGVDRGAEGRGRGGEGEVYERENEEGEGKDEGRDEWAIGVRELGMNGKGVVGKNLLPEGGVNAEGEKESGAAVDFVIEDASTHNPKIHAATASQASTVPVIRLTIPVSDITSTIASSHDAEHGIIPEVCYSNTLDQHRRQRVRFDEALRMHSYGGSQYVGRVVDKDLERVKSEMEEDEKEAWSGSA